MADQKITISATPSKVKSISVSNATVANKIVATPDTSLYYSNLSKQWATKMDGLVVGEDYSSKYYAENAKLSAETAKMEASAANALVPQLRENFEDYNEQLIETKNTGIEEIKASVDPVIDEIETVTIVANNIDVVTDIGENLDNILNKTVKVGKTKTGEAGTQASVVNAGTNLNPVLDFTIPRGQKGADGGMTAEYIEETETLDLYSETGTMLNPKWGNITGDISSQADLQNALNNKANKSEITNFATKTQVMQAIASIPQFKLSIVNELPTTGEKMTLYFVPKEGVDNDIYNEYVWIEETSSFEFLGSTAVDLTDYVKKIDYATTNTYGVVKVNTTGAYGIGMNETAGLYIASATDQQVTAKTSSNKAITPKVLDHAVKTGVTTNTIELTDDEKTSACNWLGTVKTVSLTQAEYDVLETKDANTLYLIEE